MSKSESASAAISTESVGFLEDVKKGKPRKFAMICKGTHIVSLVVYKKGGIEKRKKEAKESGKGQFYFGAVNGKGMDIRFMLARADGFEAGPVKRTVLKTFLEESANLKCKPLFEIVDAAPLVLDEDDPLVARFLKLQDAALAACDSYPERASEINTLCMLIGGHFDQDQPDQATIKLDELETLLGSLDGVASSGTAEPSQNAEPPQDSAGVLQRLKAMAPAIKTALAGPEASRVRTLVDAVKGLINAKDFVQANKVIDELESIFETATGSQPQTDQSPSGSGSGSTDGRADQLMAAFNKLVPAVKRAVADLPHRKADILSGVSAFQSHMKANAFQEAKQSLLDVGALLKSLKAEAGSATSPPTESTSDVASFEQQWIQAKEVWQTCIETVDSQINATRSAMLNLGFPELKTIADLGLPALTDNHKTPVMKGIFDIDRSSGDARKQLAIELRSSIAAFREHVTSDEMVNVLDAQSKAAFGVQMTIRDEVVKGLDALDQAIQTVISA